MDSGDAAEGVLIAKTTAMSIDGTSECYGVVGVGNKGV